MEITYKTKKGTYQLEKLSSRKKKKNTKSCFITTRKALAAPWRQGQMDNSNTQLTNDNSATNEIYFIIYIAAVNRLSKLSFAVDWRGGISYVG